MKMRTLSIRPNWSLDSAHQTFGWFDRGGAERILGEGWPYEPGPLRSNETERK